MLGFDPSESARERLRGLGGEPVESQDALLARADVLVATTGRAGIIAASQVRRGQGILALTNPDPEIRPEDALAAGAAFAADGRSVNNLLGFPGILRAAIDVRARRITQSMYLAAARAIAGLAPRERARAEPAPHGRPRAVARAVAHAAIEAGVARQEVPSDYMLESEPFRALKTTDR